MATAKQLAWRKKFVAMVRAHKFKRKGRKGRDAARTRKGTGVRQKNPLASRVVIRGDKFRIARIMADAGIPFIFVREAGKNTVGDVPNQHLDKLTRLLASRPELEGRFARHANGRKKNPSRVRIVHNKLLGGWFIVRGPHQTPLGGRFNSKAEAQAHLDRGHTGRTVTYKRAPWQNPRKKNPSARFTDSQLSRLRAAYAKLERIDPGKSGYKLLAAYLSNLTQPQLKQLAGAQIKFLSKLALNRIRK